ncbi:hypothetical protein [Aquimarina sp. AU119]|uniref:hypothetical protein n=1 Tax=Aquimarina sp. AU119 TaxID=2108528 RepID=UPI000D69D949|nr:hypothetical protein [Aquimarina sp. AU119]
MRFENNEYGKRLQMVLIELDVTPYKFSKELSYKSPDTVYHIINGKNGLSNNFLKRIEDSNYSINIDWLKTGHGEPLNHSIGKGKYRNEIFCEDKILYPSELNFFFIKKIAIAFAKVIDIEETSYKVDAKIAGIKGLEFRYITFGEQENKLSKHRIYSIILGLDWIISSYADYWDMIARNSIKGQNLLELYSSNGIKQIFENAIFPIHKEIHDTKNLWEKDSEPFLIEKFLEIDDPFKELYNTDSRITEIPERTSSNQYY